MTPKIFISYRHDDSQDFTDRLFEHMSRHFGQQNVFQDVGDSTKIPVGVDWVEHLAEQVSYCDVVLVVIGEQWLTMLQERQTRIDDRVRIEIESALKQSKIIIPVLKSKTEMPTPNTLPESIRHLSRIQASRVRPNPDFTRDCDSLAEGIRQAMERVKSKPSMQPQSPVLTAHPSAPIVKKSKSPIDPVQTALQRARDFAKTGKRSRDLMSFAKTGNRNRDWKPFITTFSDLKIPDMTFCLVPTGTFDMGMGEESHIQTLEEPFYIAQYPVTNAQWRVAVEVGVLKEPWANGKQWYDDPEMANAPVVGITWFDAQKFAEWVGCRLPTEREWEYAARGVESWIYPWGSSWDEYNVVYYDNADNKPSDVSSRPDGASWVGAQHLSGNVWEWTASLKGNYPYPSDGRREAYNGTRDDSNRISRGGSWTSYRAYMQMSLRKARYAGNVEIDLGFRLARSV
jgi:formylglycine-generating enzyme required for sulfatase activity